MVYPSAQKTICLASVPLGWLDSIFHTVFTSGTEEIEVHCSVVSRVGQPVLLLNIWAAFCSNTPWARTLSLASPQLLVTEKFSRNPEEQGSIEKHWTCFSWWCGHMCRESGGSVTQGLGTEFYRALLNTDHAAECVNHGKVWRLEMPSRCTYSLLSSICTLFSNVCIWELKIRLNG